MTSSMIASRADLLTAVKNLLQPYLNRKEISRDAFKELAKAAVATFKSFPLPREEVEKKVEELVRPESSTVTKDNAEVEDATVANVSEKVPAPPAELPPPRKVPLTLSMLKNHMKNVKERTQLEQTRLAEAPLVTAPEKEPEEQAVTEEKQPLPSEPQEDENPQKRQRVEKQQASTAAKPTLADDDDDLYGDLESSDTMAREKGGQMGSVLQHPPHQSHPPYWRAY